MLFAEAPEAEDRIEGGLSKVCDMEVDGEAEGVYFGVSFRTANFVVWTPGEKASRYGSWSGMQLARAS